MNLSFIPPMGDIPELSMNTTETHYTPLEDFKIIITTIPFLFCCILRCCHSRANSNTTNERRVYLKEELLNHDKNEECSICLESYRQGDSILILNCSHTFHKQCIELWFQKEFNCPNCRLTV
jgi:hypothetical protein